MDSEPATVDAFAEWVAPHAAAMRQLAARLCGSTDGEDVVQDSLVRAWRRWETFRPKRGSPRAWLLAIVADQVRQRRRRRPALFVAPVSTSFEPDVDLERAIAMPARVVTNGMPIVCSAIPRRSPRPARGHDGWRPAFRAVAT